MYAIRSYYEQRVLESVFRFQEGTRAMDNVSHLVVNMHHYAPEDIVRGDFMMEQFDEHMIRALLAQMTPDNLRLQLVAPGLETDRVAEWYATPYSVEPIDHAWLNIWRHARIEDPGLTLPAPNPFISDRLEPHPIGSPEPHPRCLIDRPGMRLWHLHESEFRVPKGNLFVA